MFRNAFMFALRNLRKNKLIAFINVLGLTIGISSCLVIFLIANHELSYDTFHRDGDKIFRIYSSFGGQSSGVNRGVPAPMHDWVRNEFSGLDGVAGFHTFSPTVSIPQAAGEPKKLDGRYHAIITDAGYFDVFTHYEWIAGNPKQSLTQPFNIVLTESQATLYFGNKNMKEIVGQTLFYNDSLELTVSGILKDVPYRTDFDFTDFVSHSTVEKSWLKNRLSSGWSSISSNSQLFIRVSPKTTESHLNQEIVRLKAHYDSQNKPDWVYTPTLQPLSDVHFNSKVHIFDYSRGVAEKTTLQILIGIAALLLLIAVINFINLETAQASRRAKEVGVRKVLGSSRGKLISHFLVESFILSFTAVVLSTGLSWLAIKYFSEFIPPGLRLNLTEPTVAIFLVSCIFIVALLAGLYPSFVLSSYQPALALKNISASGSTRTAWVRKGLTVFQFTFSQVLIISTIVVASQISFMLNKDLGFSADGIMYFYGDWEGKAEQRFLLRNELAQMPEIEVISMHNEPPASGSTSSSQFEFDNGKEKLKHTVYRKGGDTAYVKLYQLQIIAGRNLSHSDTAKEYLINETYVREMGYDDPRDAIGKVVNKLPVVGVVKDFHDRPLRSKIFPLIIFNDMKDFNTFGIRFASNISEEVRADAMKKIEALYKKIYPDDTFNSYYVTDQVKNFYRSESRTGTLAWTATIIAILISCLGLFGLSSFTVLQRTKEIGIRKVLGASVNNIVMLLSRDSLILIAIAFLLSAPIAYYIGDTWLQRFAYRMDLGAWIFIAALGMSIAIAFLTTSLRTVGAAKADPVKSLRYE